MRGACLEPVSLVVYVSSSEKPLSQSEILNILRVSRRNNTRDGITGMLLYKDGNFMQVLEGPEAAVERALERIRLDKRHFGVIELLKRPNQERQFPDWSMGFKSFEELTPEDAASFSPFLKKSLQTDASPVNPGVAYKLLCQFAKSVR